MSTWDTGRLESFIHLAIEAPPDVSVHVLLWGEGNEAYQPRIAEIDFRAGSSGSTLMQVDPEASAALFAAERLLLAYKFNGQPDWPEDMIEEAEWLLTDAISK